jgi:hypothetical protein
LAVGGWGLGVGDRSFRFRGVWGLGFEGCCWIGERRKGTSVTKVTNHLGFEVWLDEPTNVGMRVVALSLFRV